MLTKPALAESSLRSLMTTTGQNNHSAKPLAAWRSLTPHWDIALVMAPREEWRLRDGGHVRSNTAPARDDPSKKCMLVECFPLPALSGYGALLCVVLILSRLSHGERGFNSCCDNENVLLLLMYSQGCIKAICTIGKSRHLCTMTLCGMAGVPFSSQMKQ